MNGAMNNRPACVGGRVPFATLQLGVFLAAATSLFHRVFRRVQCNLGIRCGDEIDTELVAQPDQVEQHVRHF